MSDRRSNEALVADALVEIQQVGGHSEKSVRELARRLERAEAERDEVRAERDIHERLARAAKAFLWDQDEETLYELREARATWESEIGRFRLRAAEGDTP